METCTSKIVKHIKIVQEKWKPLNHKIKNESNKCKISKIMLYCIKSCYLEIKLYYSAINKTE